MRVISADVGRYREAGKTQRKEGQAGREERDADGERDKWTSGKGAGVQSGHSLVLRSAKLTHSQQGGQGPPQPQAWS